MATEGVTSRLLPALLGWCLSLWLACGIAVALAAISAFPTMSERGVVVPGFESLASHDAEASGRLAAGFVMDRVFAATDLAQWILAPIATAMAVACWSRLAGRRGGRLAATVGILSGLGLGLTLVHNIAIGPAMQTSLANYRELLLDGDLDAALAVRREFDTTHGLADRWYGVRMLAVGLALPLALIMPGLPTRTAS